MRRDHEHDNPESENRAQSAPDWSVQTVQTVYIWRKTHKFVPHTDIIELPDRLQVLIEIAGMTPEAFTITLLNRRLIVQGRRERPPMQSAAYHRVEIAYGDFRVEVALPFNVRRDDVTANYHEGLLQIDLPRMEDGRIHIVNVGETAPVNDGFPGSAPQANDGNEGQNNDERLD
ncbi:MAG: Hsp20/alpha crystallin family protein [bacterium]|nr:Hsp20/alpha crystallin family protein [bacterium]